MCKNSSFLRYTQIFRVKKRNYIKKAKERQQRKRKRKVRYSTILLNERTNITTVVSILSHCKTKNRIRCCLPTSYPTLVAAAELDANNISTDLGNLVKVSDLLGSGQTINDDNGVDFAQRICESADDDLMEEEKIYLYVPQTFVNLYNRAFLKKFGSVPYNTGYNHKVIEGFENVEMVPLRSKKNATFFQLTTRSNMLVGVNEANNSDAENLRVEKHHPFKLDFVATKFFGTQFENINKERILFITDDGTQSLIKKGAGLADVSSLDNEELPVNDGADGSSVNDDAEE